MAITLNGTTGITSPEVTLDNTAADGGQVVLKSSGYDNWNLDNYSGRLRAYNGSTERMTIDGSGNVGIGTSSPSYKLQISGTSSASPTLALQTPAGGSDTKAGTIGFYRDSTLRASILLDANDAGFKLNNPDSFGFISASTNGSERMRIYANGNVGISNNLDFVGGAATVRIHLSGGTPSNSNTGIAAAWNVHSDYRLKENITPLTESLHKVSLLKPVTFSWKAEENGEITAGFLAHELAEQAPYAVFGEKDAVNEDGSIKAQAADYSKVVPLLVAAIQEQQAIITDLKARIETLENR